ncbi:MAG: PAS domain S-box protein [Pirellulaceae bacterium]
MSPPERTRDELVRKVESVRQPSGHPTQFPVQTTDITELSHSAERLQRSNDILQAIQAVQALFIAERDPQAVFEELLQILVHATQSQYGFLDEVFVREDGTPYKRSLAITDISWDDASRQLYQQLAEHNFLFANLNNLAGASITSGEVVVSNDPHHDSRSGRLPPGHPSLDSFLGIPLHYGGKLVGVAGVANREGGYCEEMAVHLKPLISTCAGIVAACRARQSTEEAHQALVESEKHFQLLYEQAPLGYQSLNAAGHILDVNRAWLDLLGYVRREVIGRSFADLLVPTQRALFLQRFPRFKEVGEIHGAEFELIRKDGNRITISVDGRVARDGTGTFLRAHCILTDITVRKRSEWLLVLERDLAADLSRAQNVDEVLQRTLKAALDATGLECGGLYVLDDPRGAPRLACHAGLSPELLQACADFGCGSEHARCLEEDRFLQIDGERLQTPTFDIARREGLRFVVVAPVMHEGRSIACLQLGSRTASCIAPEAQHAFEAITSLMGVALARARAAVSLRENQAELRAVYDNSPIMMCVLDSQYCLLYMNRSMSEFVGKTEAELRFQRLGGIIGCISASGEPRACEQGADCQFCDLRLALEKTLTTGRSHNGIERRTMVSRPDGPQEVTLRAATGLIDTSAGKRLLVSLEDITARKKAEEHLRLQSLVLDQIADRVTVTDLDGRITYVNDAQCLGFGCSRTDLIGQSVMAYGGQPAGGDAQRQIMEATRREGQWRGEVVNRGSDGAEFILDCRTHLVVDDAGQPRALCEISTDITQRKRAEEKLRASAERFRSLFESMEEGFYLAELIVDDAGTPVDWRFLDVNPAYERIMGQPRESVIGRTVRQLYPDLEDSWFQAHARVALTGDSISLEGMFQATGRYYANRLYSPYPGQFACIFSDISRTKADESRLADMQLQLHHTSRLATMGELATGIAHDVNQPLCSITNFANACRNVASGQNADLRQIREWSGAIASSAARAGDIVRRLLSYARRPPSGREVMDVRELFDDAVLLVQHEAQVNRVTIRLADANQALTVSAQRVPIQQVMVNLLRNSIDALATATLARRQVTVHATSRDDHVEIAVSDNGLGLSEPERQRVFEPFFTTKPQGLGLGLAISKTIVEDHGGKIWADNNRDGGLTVHFTLSSGED